MSNTVVSEEEQKHYSQITDRQNLVSAQAAFSQKKQYDGFEIIDDERNKNKDRILLENQIRGLLGSVPIKIDEKGYLLQLMHD